MNEWIILINESVGQLFSIWGLEASGNWDWSNVNNCWYYCDVSWKELWGVSSNMIRNLITIDTMSCAWFPLFFLLNNQGKNIIDVGNGINQQNLNPNLRKWVIETHDEPHHILHVIMLKDWTCTNNGIDRSYWRGNNAWRQQKKEQ